MIKTYFNLLFVSLLVVLGTSGASADSTVLWDFEQANYGQWQVSGDCFGNSPARGTLVGQQSVTGFVGEGLVNTFISGDQSTGVALSPTFTIARDHVCFLIGGGNLPGEVGMELLVAGQSVRTATGDDAEQLRWSSWDVAELKGKTARVRIYDRARGGWGHINVDQITSSDEACDESVSEQLATYRQSPQYYQEGYRPQFHFTPEINWMNDPNGLVYFDGEYHLFYQYNPFGIEWGHMSWGHAVSPDLVHWQHLPLALAEEGDTMIFSGCAVIDWKNTSGFGDGKTPAMVAVYTGHQSDNQSQHLAYSLDRGRTWTKYAGNPVLDIQMKDFRDPKVFWHEPTSKWVMVVSLANEKRLHFYSSSDLKSWSFESEFGPAGVANKANWECPDMFELPIEGEDGTRWVLEVDMGGGAIAGGSGGEYFVGTFDGHTFKLEPDNTTGESQWVDFGRDFYAPVSWSDIPKSDGRRIWLAWMNNWETCLVPTSPWRSAMSVPRELSLRRADKGLTMIQRPVAELAKLRGEPDAELAERQIAPGEDLHPMATDGRTIEIEAEFKIGEAAEFGIRVRVGDGEQTVVGYDVEKEELFVDRRQSGDVNFHAAFSGRHGGKLAPHDGAIRMRILVDRSSIEVFGNEGQCVITERIFPSDSSRGVEIYSIGGDTTVKQLTLWTLDSTWNR